MENHESKEAHMDTHFTTDTTPAEDASRARLIEVLESLEAQIQKQTSLKFAFLKGAIYGLGTVIGATILLALLGGVLATAVSSMQELPFVGSYFDTYIDEQL